MGFVCLWLLSSVIIKLSIFVYFNVCKEYIILIFYVRCEVKNHFFRPTVEIWGCSETEEIYPRVGEENTWTLENRRHVFRGSRVILNVKIEIGNRFWYIRIKNNIDKFRNHMTQAFSWMNKCPEIGDSLCLKFYCIIIVSRDHFIFNSHSPGTSNRVNM